jgi:GH35 family endo-1,4-beta-xylanase
MILQTSKNTNDNTKTTQIMKRVYLLLKKRNLFKILSTALLVLTLSLQSNAQTLQSVIPSGKYFGTIYANSPSSTSLDIASSQFNAMVMENGMKMDNIMKNYNSANFPNVTEADLNLVEVNNFIDFCDANGLRKRGHTLMWHNQVPGFLNTLKPNGAAINTFMQNYITAFVGALAGRIDEWDVANEMLDDSGNGFRTGTWYANIAISNPSATNYSAALDNLLANCFTWAHAADPDAKLFYNDYSIEGLGWPKATSAYNLVDRLITAGAPIDGIGFQSHFSTGNFLPTSQVSSVVANIQKYANLTSVGNKPVEVAITEFDLRGSAGSMTAQQKEDAYYDMVGQTLAEPNCNLFLIWGISECCSWIPSAFSGQVPFLLYNNSYAQNGNASGSIGAWHGAYQALNEAYILGVNDFGYKNKSVTISPNPATNNLIISGLTSSDKSFEVKDILGKSILKKTIVSDEEASIDVSKLQSGFYFLTTRSGKVAKIIKN